VSVVVPTYNRSASLGRLLNALDRQTFSDFEVLVVDDGSSDGTIGFLRTRISPFSIRLIEQQHAGPAAARNRGVAEAKGKFILFLDDDVVPIPELIERHIMEHASNPNAVVIGPMSPPGNWPRAIWIRWEEVQLDKQYRAMVAGEWACTARQFYTANASVARSRFLDAGGFDTGFKRAEDVELGYRLSDQQALFVFQPRAEVLHYASRSFESWCRTPYQYGRYDVVMQRDKGQRTLENAIREFRSRHPLNRRLLRICSGRPLVARLAVSGLAGFARAAERVGAHRLALHALSAVFNVLYWQGVLEELTHGRPKVSTAGGRYLDRATQHDAEPTAAARGHL
jgi:glycosyltransferase involved in cell wall biosynthesis